MSFVFVSHAAPDKRTHVRPLVQALAIEGVSLWLDRPGSGPNDFQLAPEFVSRHQIQCLRLGLDWDDGIKSALRDAGAVLICLSKASFEPGRDVLQQEMWGAQLTRKAVTCIVDDLDLSAVPQERGLLALGKSQSLRIDTKTLRLAIDWLSADASRTPDQLPKRFHLAWQDVRRLRDELHRTRDEAQLASPSQSSGWYSGLLSGFRGKLEEFFDLYSGSDEFPLPFAGRSAERGVLRKWFDDPDAPARLLVVGPMGRGKSALLVRFAREMLDASSPGVDYDGWHVVFVPISMRIGTHSPDVYLEMLVSWLAQIARLPTDSIRERHSEAGYESACRSLVDRIIAQGRKLLIIVDGIDEALGEGFSASWFPRTTAGKARLVLSARQQLEQPDVAAWIAHLGWQGESESLALEPLDVSGVQEVLAAFHPRNGLPQSPPDALVERLWRLSGGEPFLLSMMAQELWPIRGIGTTITLVELNTWKPGFGAYFQRWMDQQRRAWKAEKKAGERIDETEINAYLAVLACARGRLSARELADVARRAYGIVPGLRIEDTLWPVRRFVLGTSRSGLAAGKGFVLGHPKLAEFFLEHYDEAAIEKARLAFAEWGLEVLNQIACGGEDHPDTPQYLLERLEQHLRDVGATCDNYLGMLSYGWRRAHQAYGGNLEGYKRDLLAFASAIGKQRPANWRAQLLRCNLVFSSARTAGVIPAALVLAAVQHGLTGVDTALRALETAPVELRWRSLRRLAPLVPPAQRKLAVDDALVAARQAAPGRDRALALAEVGEVLPREERRAIEQEVYEQFPEMASLSDFLEAVDGVAPHISTNGRWRLLQWLLENVSSEGDWYYLLNLLPHMDDAQRLQAIASAATRNQKLPERKSPDLSADSPIYPTLTGNLLAVVFRWLPEAQQCGLRDRALAAARASQDEIVRGIGLAGLAGFACGEERERLKVEAMAAFRAEGTRNIRIFGASDLARQLPLEERPAVLESALELACGAIYSDSFSRFGHIAPVLDSVGIERALEAVSTAALHSAKVAALNELAPFLHKDQVARGLEILDHFDDWGIRVACLLSLATQGSPEVLERTWLDAKAHVFGPETRLLDSWIYRKLYPVVPVGFAEDIRRAGLRKWLADLPYWEAPSAAGILVDIWPGLDKTAAARITQIASLEDWKVGRIEEALREAAPDPHTFVDKSTIGRNTTEEPVEMLFTWLNDELTDNRLRVLCSSLDRIPAGKRALVLERVARDAAFIDRSSVIDSIDRCAPAFVEVEGSASLAVLADAVLKAGSVFP